MARVEWEAMDAAAATTEEMAAARRPTCDPERKHQQKKKRESVTREGCAAPAPVVARGHAWCTLGSVARRCTTARDAVAPRPSRDGSSIHQRTAWRHTGGPRPGHRRKMKKPCMCARKESVSKRSAREPLKRSPGRNQSAHVSTVVCTNRGGGVSKVSAMLDSHKRATLACAVGTSHTTTVARPSGVVPPQ